MAFLCLRFLGIENSTLSEVLQIQMALLFLLYFAPTPGSSGLAEVFSLSAMAAIVPAGLAPYYNLIWRASTVYLSAILGLLFLALTLLRDTQSILRRPGRPCDSRLELPKAVRGRVIKTLPFFFRRVTIASVDHSFQKAAELKATDYDPEIWAAKVDQSDTNRGLLSFLY